MVFSKVVFPEPEGNILINDRILQHLSENEKAELRRHRGEASSGCEASPDG